MVNESVPCPFARASVNQERVSHAMNISADVVVEKEDLEEQARAFLLLLLFLFVF